MVRRGSRLALKLSSSLAAAQSICPQLRMCVCLFPALPQSSSCSGPSLVSWIHPLPAPGPLTGLYTQPLDAAQLSQTISHTCLPGSYKFPPSPHSPCLSGTSQENAQFQSLDPAQVSYLPCLLSAWRELGEWEAAARGWDVESGWTGSIAGPVTLVKSLETLWAVSFPVCERWVRTLTPSS